METEKKLSRQRKYQLDNEKKGLCQLCPRKAVKGIKVCKHHREINYGRKRNKSLDKPLRSDNIHSFSI